MKRIKLPPDVDVETPDPIFPPKSPQRKLGVWGGLAAFGVMTAIITSVMSPLWLVFTYFLLWILEIMGLIEPITRGIW
jgi:hypothetical protein